jgi:uncharacterized protein (DUF1501 family)
MITRRELLRSLPLISLAPTIPGFLARSARAAAPQKEGRVLVVIQLDGGNDGINTVVPFKDEGYARHREILRLPTNRLIRIADGVGLHPAMRGAGKLLESGRLAIVPGVGYPNPSRSHFQSMAVWHTARFDPKDHDGPGWIGRGLDSAPLPAPNGPSSLYIGAGALPAALRGISTTASALERIDDLVLDGPTASTFTPRDAPETRDAPDDLTAFVQRTTLDAYAAADRLAALGRDDSSARYPSTALANRLGLIARLLKGGFGARVFYTVQGSYDTHAAQPGAHSQLLTELSGALEAFLDDLAISGLLDRVLVLAFSEFGRRVAENSTAGTDHGTSGPVFLAGSKLRPGLVGSYPSLTDLTDGDLKTTIDFRRVYATLLEDWLGLGSHKTLNGTFEPMPLFRTRSGQFPC